MIEDGGERWPIIVDRSIDEDDRFSNANDRNGVYMIDDWHFMMTVDNGPTTDRSMMMVYHQGPMMVADDR